MDSSIQDTEKLLSKFIDDANVFVLFLNNVGNVALCNKKVEEITGRKKENILGLYWLNVLYRDTDSPINQQMFKVVMDDSINYKRPNNFEGVITTSDNNQQFICWSITPMLTESGELEGVLLVGNDITEIKERETALRKIDETLKDIFSSIKEYALYVSNLDGNITYYGMGFEAMFGWQKDEVIFKHINILHTEEDAKSKLLFILEQVKQRGQYETDLELKRKDGECFPVTLTVSQFIDALGQRIGYIFMAKDITERKKLEYQIFQTEKLAAIGQLAAGMAHEVNNPLFVISGRLEMILAEKRLSAKLKEELNIINTQADRIRKLIDRFLKFSRKTTPKLEELDINEVIESVLPFLTYHKLPAAKVDIEKRLNVDLPPIKGDLNQLQEVFVNLLINAYQAMPEGGTITIKTSNFMNSFAQIIISDTGRGIAQEDLKNIFMPFFSTKRDGTGLGLSICYNIIKSHNGFIDIETKVNKGTTFIIKLPFA